MYTWGVCREPCTKLGMNWEERILRLHWMVHVVVHIQQFNKRSVKYQPYGPWGHFPKRMFGTKPCSVDSDSSTSDSDSDSDSDSNSNSNSDAHSGSSSNSNSNTDSDSGSSLTSCSPDPLSSEPDYSPDEE